MIDSSFRLPVALVLAIGCLEIPGALNASEAPPPSERPYAWKAGEVFRFDYAKVITITQSNEKGAIEDRKIELSAVLILEVTGNRGAPVPESASGTLRFDSIQVVLPPVRVFASAEYAPQVQKDKDKLLADSIKGALKLARWTVVFHSDGRLEFTARAPADLQDLLRETAAVGAWRKKAMKKQIENIETALGLAIPSMDRQFLLCFSAEDAATGGTAGAAADPLRPRRSRPRVAASAQDKLKLAFTRQPPASAKSPIRVPGLEDDDKDKVRVSFEDLATHAGNAEFDLKLGMLDWLEEDFTASLRYSSGGETLDQKVRVEYRLKRLAPPVRKLE